MVNRIEIGAPKIFRCTGVGEAELSRFRFKGVDDSKSGVRGSPNSSSIE